MKLRRNTIIVTVAPSNAGKTYYCQNHLLPLLGVSGFRTQYISSDDIRRELVGDDLHKHDPKLFAVSKQAFSVLKNRLINFVQYPVNTDFVVVDSTGLSESFRKDIENIAYQNNYDVKYLLFDYDTSEYYDLADEDTNKNVIKNHARRFKTEVLGSIKNSKTISKTFIRGRDKFDHPIEFEASEAKVCKISEKDSYCVIGDVHGCYEELAEMLEKCSRFDHIILVGDLIDKRNDLEASKKVLRLVLDSPKTCLVKGNHEHFAMLYWDDKASSTPQEVVDEHFHDAANADEEFKELLYKALQNSYDFVQTKDAIVTHSPHQRKFTGKVDSFSLKQQRNFRHALKDGKTLAEKLEFLHREDERCFPYHISGHIALDRAFLNGSNILIDTGAVYGNCLTAVYIDGDKPRFIKVASKDKYCEGEVQSLKFGSKPQIDEGSKAYRRAKAMVQKGIKYISPTMSPSEKREGNLEGIHSALLYYQEKGIEHVSIQVKHMGSRGQVYLHKRPEDCYTVTRNGFLLREELHQQFIDNGSYQKLIDRLLVNDIDSMIIDCELMPWSLLGEELIERSFCRYSNLAKAELKALQNSGFYEQIAKAYESLPIEELKKLENKELFIKKHGQHTYSLCKKYTELMRSWIPQEDLQKGIRTFDEQMIAFGGQGSAEILPFAVLSYVKEGKTIIPETGSNSAMYQWVNGPSQNEIQISVEKALAGSSELANFLIQYHSSDDSENAKIQEGIVIKPDQIYTPGVAPYLKVREPDYLHIVYGPDYKSKAKYDRLVAKKNTRHKLRASIEQFEAGLAMLKAEDPTLIMAEFLSKKDKISTKIDPRF